MDESKIEPRLRREMGRLEEEGRAGAPIPVLVQIASEEAAGDATSYEALAKRLHAGVQAIGERLAQSGFAGPMQENVLAGSLELRLTSEQIAAVSGLAEVKRVILNRIDQVACAAEI